MSGELIWKAVRFLLVASAYNIHRNRAVGKLDHKLFIANYVKQVVSFFHENVKPESHGHTFCSSFGGQRGPGGVLDAWR